ncbi:hypothetical protein HPB48_018794 [Haemaphysalis longicornis]|uniref:Uncharacterized protein n=1 Tax=Haemaphysalis longicornis TaxID=44386 RepID=A0A9J6GYP8_HAELO|nr:hypothetical protein HPB48_018794 [Haemaphysalis longicornis]
MLVREVPGFTYTESLFFCPLSVPPCFSQKSASSSSKKMVKRTLSKACRYVSLGALCSSPVLLTSYPTEPNMATSHRSSWSAWTEPVTWCHSAQFM